RCVEHEQPEEAARGDEEPRPVDAVLLPQLLRPERVEDRRTPGVIEVAALDLVEDGREVLREVDHDPVEMVRPAPRVEAVPLEDPRCPGTNSDVWSGACPRRAPLPPGEDARLSRSLS